MRYLITTHNSNNAKWKNLTSYKPITLKELLQLNEIYPFNSYFKSKQRKLPYIEIKHNDHILIHLIFDDLNEAKIIEKQLKKIPNMKNNHSGEYGIAAPVEVTFDMITLMDKLKDKEESYTDFLRRLVYDSYYKEIFAVTRRNKQNISGFLGVSKKYSEYCNQGFTWRYQYTDKGVRKEINRANLLNLKEAVIEKNLPWGIINVEIAENTCDCYKYDIQELI